jgi:hypothetical protein
LLGRFSQPSQQATHQQQQQQGAQRWSWERRWSLLITLPAVEQALMQDAVVWPVTLELLLVVAFGQGRCEEMIVAGCG